MEELNTGATSTVTTCSSSAFTSFLVEHPNRTRLANSIRQTSREAARENSPGRKPRVNGCLKGSFTIFRNFLSRFAASPVQRDTGFVHHHTRYAPARACSAHPRLPEQSIPRLDIAD